MWPGSARDIARFLREEVGGTVAEASEADAELRHLCEVLAVD